MIVYFDYDGVCADTMTPSIKEMKELGLYDTEEGRTKYYRELQWGPFLERTGLIKYVAWTINRFMELNYETTILTHCNSLPESEDKCKYIKSNEEIVHPEELNIISVPRKLDKSFVINSKGNVLWDDRIHNIETWNKDGGIGVLCDTVKHDSYPTMTDPLHFLAYVTSINEFNNHEKYMQNYDLIQNSNEKASKDFLKSIREKLIENKSSIETFLIYDKLVKDGFIKDETYFDKQYDTSFYAHYTTNIWFKNIAGAIRKYYDLAAGIYREKYENEFNSEFSLDHNLDSLNNFLRTNRYDVIKELYNLNKQDTKNKLNFSHNVFYFEEFQRILNYLSENEKIGLVLK